jgi:Lipocalin-like domain
VDQLEGIWRLVDSRAWDEQHKRWTAPYGAHPLGHISFSNGRMLCALCKGDSYAGSDGSRQFISYGGTYRFDGTELEVVVDVASDPDRIGTRQIRGLVMMGEEMQLRPPVRLYGGSLQQREVIWERVWRPHDENRADPDQLRIVVAGD